MSQTDLAQVILGSCTCRELQSERAVAHGEATQEGATDPTPTSDRRTLDVTQLTPPLPMIRILEALRDLGPEQTLVVRHNRRPTHLYPKLDALGCHYQTVEDSPGNVEVWITARTAKAS
ncbi:MAG: DUF2249 domain-containing protein [Chloroflexi bacterium]|nr:DUF2249 domain-containing protein [Chloroflexota bacterium]